MQRIIYFLSFLLISAIASAQDLTPRQCDSLFFLFNKLDDRDTLKLEVCRRLAIDNPSADSAAVYNQKLFQLCDLHPEKFVYRLHAIYNQGYLLYLESKYSEAINKDFEGIILADSLGYQNWVAKFNSAVGKNSSYLCDYYQADEYYNKALAYYEQTADTIEISYLYGLLALNYGDQRMWQKGEELFRKCIEMDSLMGNDVEMSYHYQDLGDLYLLNYLLTRSEHNIDLLAKSRNCFYDAMSIYYDEPYCRYSVCLSLSYILYFDAVERGLKGDDINKLIEVLQMFYDDGHDAVQQVGVQSEMIFFEFVKVNLDILKRRYKEAKTLLDSLADEILSNDDVYSDKLIYLYTIYDNYFTAIGDYKSASEYKAKFYERCNSLQSMDYAVSSAQKLAQTRFNEITRQRDVRDARQKLITMIWIAALALLAAFFTWEYFRKRRHNRVLNEKNIQLLTQREEILSQKEEIQAQSEELLVQNEQITKQNAEITVQNIKITEKNRQITDSINYASLIQKAVLPKDDLMKSLFHDYFLIYRPLNIVAGDFYWVQKIGCWRVLVCADCTGHGVPGAFVSMLGVSLLNSICHRIIDDNGNAADILNDLRTSLMNALGQDRDQYQRGERMNMDGMDLTLLMIHDDNTTMHFAGAYRPLWIYRGGQIIQYKPDKMPIGLYIGRHTDFTDNLITLQKNDVLYMFSDGIPDQFGYVDEEKNVSKHFSMKRLSDLLSQIGDRPMDEQRKTIENAVDTWRNGYKQLDDNILIGVRV